MSDTLIQLQVFFEIAMSIGTSLDLSKMLQTSLSTILGRLSCSAGAVIESRMREDGQCDNTLVFSIPRRIHLTPILGVALKSIPSGVSRDAYHAFNTQLPLVLAESDTVFSHIFELPGFGFLVLAKSRAPLGDKIIRSLKPINRKLAESSMACRQNEKIGQLYDRLQAEVDERAKAEAQLQQSQKMEAIGNLAGGIAHDFNNILAAIMGYTELAFVYTERGTPIAKYLEEIFSASKRAKDLVRQILTFARQTDEAIKPIRVDAIARESMRFIRSTIPATIHLDHQIDCDACIMGNATQVYQIFMNLLTNAAQAMEDEGGALTVTLKEFSVDNSELAAERGLKKGRFVEITVSDTGGGISDEHISTIFEPYFTTKEPGRGTGLGLAVVHGIVESYGGKISVKSTLGRGTTFSIYLPIARKSAPACLDSTSPPATGNERVLIVDDDAAVTQMINMALSRLGYSVTARNDSIEALTLFQSNPEDFDLVITDMTMPNMTGDRLAAELMKLRPGFPVILLTGYNKQISEEAALHLGIKAFAYKPVISADLARMVRCALD